MILALESSCDESSLALFDPKVGLVGEWTHTQIDLHALYGGVVPDLASREHLRNLPALLAAARPALADFVPETVAVTRGPGLAACLALGIATAKALALAYRCNLLGVNHLRGHAWSPFIPVHGEDPAGFEARLDALLPHLGLLVSGGNTILFTIDSDRRLTVLGGTLDDAAGEALDKGAKLMGLGYPGGPLVEKTALTGDRKAFDFPRACLDTAEPRFSFSGLKTSLRYRLEKMADGELAARLPDLCASYQEAVVDVLARKAAQSLKAGGFRSLGLSGGVANNRRLREVFGEVAARQNLPLVAALPKHTGDNAGMIAFAAWVDEPGTKKMKNNQLAFAPSLVLAD